MKSNHLETEILSAENLDEYLSKPVSRWRRAINGIVDHLGILIAIRLVGFLLVLQGSWIRVFDTDMSITIFRYAIIFLSYFSYYFILEMTFQTTLGKLLTKTKVVTSEGRKPDMGEIFTRTMCRFVPFEWLSFLFKNVGFHDHFSHTKVVEKTR